MELEGLLPCSEKPATDPYPEPDISSPNFPTLFPQKSIFRCLGHSKESIQNPMPTLFWLWYRTVYLLSYPYGYSFLVKWCTTSPLLPCLCLSGQGVSGLLDGKKETHFRTLCSPDLTSLDFSFWMVYKKHLLWKSAKYMLLVKIHNLLFYSHLRSRILHMGRYFPM